MATLYVTEYIQLATQQGPTPIAQEPSSVNQTVAIGGSSAQSSAFAPNTTLIRLHTDAICSVQIGANPTATATTRRMSANQTEYFKVAQGHKVAVITNS